MATKKVNIDIIARDKSQQALNKVRGNLDGVKKAVFNVRNALAGIGAGLVIRNIVNTGKEIEGLQVRLKFLFGSAEEGAKAFDKMAKFASKVPFSLQEIQAGSGNLAVVAKDADELANLMEITGNVAAATGLDFRTAAEQIQRSFSAGIGAADLFRDRGVRAMLGFKAGATVSIEETQEAFENVFGNGGQFAGTTDALAQTLEGTLSMINDKVFTFKKNLLDAGFFGQLKREFGDLNKFLEDNEETLEELAITIGEGLAKAVVGISEGIKVLADNFTLLKSAVGGFVAFKLAMLIPKITNAVRLLRIQLSGTVALTGPTGLGLVAASFVAMEIAARDFREEVVDVREELENLTLSELQSRAAKAKLEILDLVKGNKELTKSYAEQSEELKENNGFFPEIQLNMGKQIQLEGETAKAYDESREKLILLNKELEVLNELIAKGGTKPIVDVPHALEGMEADPNDAQKVIDAEKKKQEEINAIINKNKKDSIQIFYDLLEEETLAKEKTAENVKKIKEQMKLDDDKFINELIENLKKEEKQLFLSTKFREDYASTRLESNKLLLEKEREQAKNNFHKMLDDALEFENKKAQIEKQAKDHTISEARDALEILAGMNKTAFAAFKAVRIAEATVNTYTAAVEAFKRFGGFPLGAIAAAATVAKGLALVAQIRSTSFRAGGGSVNKDQAYMVGEKGPEMFVPSGSGKIVPNNQMGNSQPVNVNFNINTVDARGFNELLVNSRGLIVNMINSAVNEKGKMAIV
jgi:hypothetical protein